MANTLKHKQSSVAGKVPTTTDLALGELAINTNDGKLYLKKNVSGTESIVDVTAGGSAPALADITNWPSAVSATEVGYLDGVTSGIQTQLDGKAPSSHTHSYQPLDADLTAIAALAGTSGFLKKTAADTWALDTTAYTANTGTVTSVGLSLPAMFSVSGSPVTGSGTLTATLSNQTANQFFCAPNGAAGTPGFRAIVAADIPTLNQNTTGTASNITAFTINQSLGTANSVQHNSLGIGTAASGTAGEIRATNNITAYYSDQRLKTIFGEIPDALGKVERMSGVYFVANDLAASYGFTDKAQQVAVIAQQVLAEVPEAVRLAPFDTAFTEEGEEYSVSGEDYLTVQYEKLVPVLLQAIKELSAKVKNLEDKVHA